MGDGKVLVVEMPARPAPRQGAIVTADGWLELLSSSGAVLLSVQNMDGARLTHRLSPVQAKILSVLLDRAAELSQTLPPAA